MRRVRGKRAVDVLLARIARRGSETASHAELARELGLSQATIERSLRQLRRDGLIASTVNYDDRGGQTSNSYQPTEAGLVRARGSGLLAPADGKGPLGAKSRHGHRTSRDR